MKAAPIILFTYNRPWHTQQTINALTKNKLADQSDLIVFSDGPQNAKDNVQVTSIRNSLKKVRGFNKVIVFERKENWGLANSIISGVTQVINEFGKAIVLEDDLITSPCFLQYMNDALNFYQDEKSVFSITGYNLPENVMAIPSDYKQDIYFNYRCHSWGWGTWKDRWDKTDWKVSTFQQFINNRQAVKSFQRGGDDLLTMLLNQMEGRIDSWAIRWCFTHFQQNAYCVYPIKSLLTNIGFDNSGVHCLEKAKKLYTGSIDYTTQHFQFTKKIEINNQLINNFCKVFRPGIMQKSLTALRLLTSRY